MLFLKNTQLINKIQEKHSSQIQDNNDETSNELVKYFEIENSLLRNKELKDRIESLK